MTPAVALNAARQLSVDVANLSYRLAIAEATLEEIRGLVFITDPDGNTFSRVDTNMWRRQPVEHGPAEVVLTEDQAVVAIGIINALNELL